jgi:hypothetical protein
MLGSGQQKLKEMRDKTIAKDNWNYFVADSEYKTDLLLRFKTPFIQQQYEKHLIASSMYSLRVVLAVAALLNYFATASAAKVMPATLISIFATSPPLFKNIPLFQSLSKFMVNHSVLFRLSIVSFYF